MVIFDANVLIALVSSRTSSDNLARLEGLLADISKRHTFVGIPTPALAEFLVRTDGATQGLFAALERKAAIRVLPFDRKAAYECSVLDRTAQSSGDKRGPAKGAPYQKVKIDRQIVAIALANGADAIISGDATLRAIASGAGLKAGTIEDLDLPASARQHPLDFDGDVKVQPQIVPVESTAVPLAAIAPTGEGE